MSNTHDFNKQYLLVIYILNPVTYLFYYMKCKNKNIIHVIIKLATPWKIK